MMSVSNDLTRKYFEKILGDRYSGIGKKDLDKKVDQQIRIMEKRRKGSSRIFEKKIEEECKSDIETDNLNIDSDRVIWNYTVIDEDVLLVNDALIDDDLLSIKDFIINQDREATTASIIAYIFTRLKWGLEKLSEDPVFIYKIVSWIKEYVDIYYRHEYSPGEMLSIENIHSNDGILHSLNETPRLNDEQKSFISDKLESDTILTEMYNLNIKAIQADRTFSVIDYLGKHYKSKFFLTDRCDDDLLRRSEQIVELVIKQCKEDAFEPSGMNPHRILDRIVEILQSLSPEEGLKYGWRNIRHFKSDLDSIIKSTRWFLYRKDVSGYNYIDYFKKIVENIGDLARRESESQSIFNQLLSEHSKDEKRQKRKVIKNKVLPVPNKVGREDNPKLELVTTVDLLHGNSNFSANTKIKYRISQRVRRWITNDINKIRQFTNGKKRIYLRMTDEEIARSRMYHHLPGTDAFINNKAYSFSTRTGKGLIVKIYYEDEVVE